VLGSVTHCGGIGASRAFDYGVVDLFFVNLMSFMSNAASLTKEGVDLNQFYTEAAKRLATIPSALKAASERMESRDNDAYAASPTVTLDAARSYWASRLPYNDAHGMPAPLTHFMVELIDQASGVGGIHGNADLSRLQEVLRYGGNKRSSGECDNPSPSKKGKTE